MRIIFIIMLSVLLLDAVLAAVFLSLWFWLAATPVFAFMSFLSYRWFFKAHATLARGWNLGPAVEITNPDRPQAVQNAIIDAKIIKLGMLVLGAPGAGKTESVVLGYLHALPTYVENAGWAFFEGKGDTDIYRKAVAMGATPDHFFSTELPGSQTINLFSGDAQDVIDRLGHSLIGATASTSFYSDEQRSVLLKIVPLLKSIPKPTNLRDLYAVLSVEDAGSALLHDAQQAGASSTSLQLARVWLEEKFSKRVASIRGLLNRLYIFCNGPSAMRLNAYQPDIDISRIVAEGKKFYLHVPLTQFAKDVAVAIIEMLHVEARKRQLAGTENAALYPLLFDDWGAFFHSNFGPFSARCRSAAMPLSFGFQSRAQLVSVSAAFADELDDTIATKIILRIQGDATAAYAQRLLGQYDKMRVGTSRHDSSRGEGSSLSSQATARIEARDLRMLQPGEAYISTLEPISKGVANPLWKLRLPLPPFPGWQKIPMPAAREHQEGEGLGYWNRFVDEQRMEEFISTLNEREQAEAAKTSTVRSTAQDSLLLNPGFGEDM